METDDDDTFVGPEVLFENNEYSESAHNLVSNVLLTSELGENSSDNIVFEKINSSLKLCEL